MNELRNRIGQKIFWSGVFIMCGLLLFMIFFGYAIIYGELQSYKPLVCYIFLFGGITTIVGGIITKEFDDEHPKVKSSVIK